MLSFPRLTRESLLDTTTNQHGKEEVEHTWGLLLRASPTPMAVTSVQETGRLTGLSVLSANAPDRKSVECCTGL